MKHTETPPQSEPAEGGLDPGQARTQDGRVLPIKISGVVPRNLGELREMGELVAAARSLQGRGVTSGADAAVKIQVGLEMGVGPMASLMNIHVVEGRPQLSSNLMAALVKRSGKYDYRCVVKTSEACKIVFYQLLSGGAEWAPIGEEVFTIEDARRAGLAGRGNWVKYPSNMLFARCLSNGVKTHCPDVGAGMPLYNEADEFSDAPQAAPRPNWHEYKAEVHAFEGDEVVKQKLVARIERQDPRYKHDQAMKLLKQINDAAAQLAAAESCDDLEASAQQLLQKYGQFVMGAETVVNAYVDRALGLPGCYDTDVEARQSYMEAIK